MIQARRPGASATVIGHPAPPAQADRPSSRLLRCGTCVDHATASVEAWERGTGATLAVLQGTPAYRRRETEKTLIHAVVHERLEPLREASYAT